MWCQVCWHCFAPSCLLWHSTTYALPPPPPPPPPQPSTTTVLTWWLRRFLGFRWPRPVSGRPSIVVLCPGREGAVLEKVEQAVVVHRPSVHRGGERGRTAWCYSARTAVRVASRVKADYARTHGGSGKRETEGLVGCGSLTWK